jgi:uncharacterized membrane protein YeaQ/YmgE (transglycosylase-associated protein family)
VPQAAPWPARSRPETAAFPQPPGGGFGLIGNIVVGIVGAFIGFYLLQYMNVPLAPGFVGVILTATLGAVILLFIVGLLRR